MLAGWLTSLKACMQARRHDGNLSILTAGLQA